MTKLIAGTFLAFTFNLVWEVAQGPLYAGHTEFWATLPMCARASVGDVLIVGSLYLFIALMRQKRTWFLDARALDWMVLIALGAAVAIVIERWALAAGRWKYGAMPVIPYVGAGVFPVLQMMIIPPLAIALLRKEVRFPC